jgi:hypothetical protein
MIVDLIIRHVWLREGLVYYNLYQKIIKSARKTCPTRRGIAVEELRRAGGFYLHVGGEFRGRENGP